MVDQCGVNCHRPAPKVSLDNGRPVILVGNPNVGKSALFSQFTGHRVDISNYPGTTVEVTQGQLKLAQTDMVLIDTPGVQSLLPNSEDELVTRDMLLSAAPWAVLQVADTKNLRRALLLTFQLAEYEKPFVLALNMADEAKALGISVDSRRLSQILGAEVVPTVATAGKGLEELRNCLVAPRPVSYCPRYEGAIETAVSQIAQYLPESWTGKRAIALALLANDSGPANHALQTSDVNPVLWQSLLEQIETIVASTASQYDQPLGYIITQQRLRCADCLLAQVWKSVV